MPFLAETHNTFKAALRQYLSAESLIFAISLLVQILAPEKAKHVSKSFCEMLKTSCTLFHSNNFDYQNNVQYD